MRKIIIHVQNIKFLFQSYVLLKHFVIGTISTPSASIQFLSFPASRTILREKKLVPETRTYYKIILLSLKL